MALHIHWLRQDLRLNDNKGLFEALTVHKQVLLVYIMDSELGHGKIFNERGAQFVYQRLSRLNEQIKIHNSSILVLNMETVRAWQHLLEKFNISSISYNRLYDPFYLKIEEELETFFIHKDIEFRGYQDFTIFEPKQLVKADNTAYKKFSSYKVKWLKQLTEQHLKVYDSNRLLHNLYKETFDFPSEEEIGVSTCKIKHPRIHFEAIMDHEKHRDFPNKETSNLSVHLHFGTISPRLLIVTHGIESSTFLDQIIWRDFFTQVLYHFPNNFNSNFKSKYDFIDWKNDESDFDRWCQGETGYPLVDAGMKQLRETGFMHNRVRMVVASFLCKDLLIDWRWGERFFAENLVDYDIALNNGNWQWVAGTGCDSAPYFRVFNPTIQMKKFDKENKYIKKWLANFNTLKYPKPMIDHAVAKERALNSYKKSFLASI